VPYSVETMRFRADPILLRKVASGTGGRVLEGTESGEHIFTRERESRFLTRPVFDWFLICLVFLIPLDVAVRRIQIDLAAVMNALGFNRDRGTSGKTLGGLLQRKSSLGIPSAGTEPPPAQYIQDIPEKKDKEKKSDQAPTVDPPVDGEPLSTTEKLLELKRRRKQDES